MANSTSNKTQPMLIFMPDIRGFSKFVNDTEIAHSQHIIEELLELLIDANEIGMQVSEVEGDAVLFYREGEPVELIRLMAQVESMYLQFHTHLKMYEHSRICQCGACSTTNNLKLKFVVSYGEVSFNKIKEHKKLFGKEVITAHRLLKNNLKADEYVIVTNKAMKAHAANGKTLPWAVFETTRQNYDIGEIEYHFVNLLALSEKVPLPKIESYGLNKSKTGVLVNSYELNVPLNFLFNVLSDYTIRHKWSVGLKDSDQLNSKISRNGSTHRCLINDNPDDPFFIAHDFKLEHNYVVFTETDHSKRVSIVYELRSLKNQSTQVQKHTFIEGGLLKRLYFSLFLKNRFIKNGKESFRNLNDYCRNLIDTGKPPPSQIILTNSSQIGNCINTSTFKNRTPVRS